jgi:hypothetical protein
MKISQEEQRLSLSCLSMTSFHPSTVGLACWRHSICSLRASTVLQSSLALPRKSFFCFGAIPIRFHNDNLCRSWTVLWPLCLILHLKLRVGFLFCTRLLGYFCIRSITSAKPRATLNQSLSILSCNNDKQLIFPSGVLWTTTPDVVMKYPQYFS